MIRLFPLFALCAACTPTGEQEAEKTYATQTEALSPDYRVLLAEESLGNVSWVRREASAPPPADAKAIGETWMARLEERDALLGAGFAGKGPDGPVISLDTGLTEQEFDGWVRENGWSVPDHISWTFVPALNLPPVADVARDGIRVWPASTARTGAQMEALLYGRVELRDGCFYVGEGNSEPDKLAWFHAEMGLDRDAQGFYVLRSRVSGQTMARIGEQMNWGGPATAVIPPQAEKALRAACGDAPIYVVGSPESSARFNTQYPPSIPPPPPPAP
ncbi:hypothetical protein [Erythrobacter sp. HKB08]|uniref:hypothetical protein n=1 Tax=Erythrobacter sp. HKB08 TaxID=2502843 RepID=UPI0010093842|nr:hypothetical protein [Erythrobacter sp. HKB08]